MIRRAFLLVMATALIAGCALRRTPSLLEPSAEKPAPDSFHVTFETSKGPFTVRAVRAWAPHGVDRFHHLVRAGYYDRVKFFRVLPGFVAQFGIHGDSAVNALWKARAIPDDSVRQSNQDGFVTFATSGRNTRTTQLFVSTRDNRRLDALGFAPIGRVISGMEVVRALYGGYGEGPPRGTGPSQAEIAREGNRYLERSYPQLDSIVRARIVKD